MCPDYALCAASPGGLCPEHAGEVREVLRAHLGLLARVLETTHGRRLDGFLQHGALPQLSWVVEPTLLLDDASYADLLMHVVQTVLQNALSAERAALYLPHNPARPDACPRWFPGIDPFDSTHWLTRQAFERLRLAMPLGPFRQLLKAAFIGLPALPVADEILGVLRTGEGPSDTAVVDARAFLEVVPEEVLPRAAKVLYDLRRGAGEIYTEMAEDSLPDPVWLPLVYALPGPAREAVEEAQRRQVWARLDEGGVNLRDAFLGLWTQAAGTTDYDRRQWQNLRGLLAARGIMV